MCECVCMQYNVLFLLFLLYNYIHMLISTAPRTWCPRLFTCVCFCALLCPDHLATICPEQAGERSQSAVISSYWNVRNSACGVGVGRT